MKTFEEQLEAVIKSTIKDEHVLLMKKIHGEIDNTVKKIFIGIGREIIRSRTRFEHCPFCLTRKTEPIFTKCEKCQLTMIDKTNDPLEKSVMVELIRPLEDDKEVVTYYKIRDSHVLQDNIVDVCQICQPKGTQK